MASRAMALGIAFIFFKASAQIVTNDKEDCEPCHVTESFLVELPFIQEKGTFQVIASSEYDSGRGEHSLLFPISLEYGISDTWQVEAEWMAFGYSRGKKEPLIRGVGESALSVRHSFSREDSRNHLTGGFEITFPTGKLGGNSIGYRPSMIYGRDFPTCHSLHLFSQLALDCVQKIRDRKGEPAAHELFVGGGALVPLGDFCASAEITWNDNRWNHGGTVNELYVAPGITWRLSDAWKCGVAVPVGLNNRSDRFQVISRIMFEF
jgi:hypothetical protein